MQGQGNMMVNPAFQVEVVNNKGYVFQPNNNLPTQYHSRLRNHENLSYGNQANVQQAPHNFSLGNAPPGFQGKKRQPGSEESILTLLNDTKRNHDD